MKPTTRRCIAALVIGLIGVAANLPPEHGHPSDGRRAGVVHRHVSLHLVGDPSHPRLSDSDGLIIWIDGSSVPGASAALGQIDAALPESMLRAPAIDAAGRVVLDVNASSIHGPPRPASASRAPPFLPAL